MVSLGALVPVTSATVGSEPLPPVLASSSSGRRTAAAEEREDDDEGDEQAAHGGTVGGRSRTASVASPGRVPSTRPPHPPRRVLPILAALVVLGGIAFVALRPGPDVDDLTLDEFEDAVTAGEVDTATIRDRSHSVRGELEDGERYKVSFPAEYGDELTTLLRDQDVEVDHRPERRAVLAVAACSASCRSCCCSG